MLIHAVWRLLAGQSLLSENFLGRVLKQKGAFQPTSGRSRTKARSSHRTVEVGGGPLEQDQVAQDIAQLGVKYLQGWRLQSFW